MFTLVSTGRRATDYKRVAADSLITVRFQDNVTLANILDNPEEDRLHFVLVDRGHQFNVDVRENDDKVSLLPAIKKDIPTSMDQANLVFYKTSYRNPEELNDTTEGQLLPNLNKLFTAFDDTPFSELPIAERKHHLSWDPVERAIKHRKLHNKAPSVMGVPEYLSLQINSTERLFGYRRRMVDCQELPEKDLPPVEVLFDGFGEFLEIWRAAYSSGFEAKPVTVEMRKNVDVFADTMSRAYLNEGARRLEGLEKLNTIFRPTGPRDSITVPGDIPGASVASQTLRTDGLSCYSGIPSIIVEFKNESAGSIAMPIVELAGYYSRIVQYLAGTRAGLEGPAITFFGLAYVGSVVYVPLTTSLWCLPVEYGGSDRHQLYIAFNAASVLLASIEQEAKRLTDARYPDPGSSIDLQIIDTIQKSLYRNVYAASSSSSGDLVIKLTYSYSHDLHAFCTDLDHAPELLAFERLPGGVFAIAMERLKGKTLDSISSISAELRDKWTRDLRAIVEKIHKKGYVHGDLRPPNIFCVDDRIMLLDFDWGGKVGEARYPHARLHPQLTTGRDMSNLEITKDDDNRVLRNTLKFLQEIVQASGVQGIVPTPDGRKNFLAPSDLPDPEEDAEKVKKKKAAIKRGKKKAAVVSSDEEREPQARRKVTRRGKI
ncbi:hypothetical protein EV363DRAFT_1417512 [Boletus edulis]|nr:hypothetical protein EV363DRAFT_1417512 [Boletus edulis]